MEWICVIRISLIAAIIGCLQGRPEITVLNNINNIACGSMTQVICTVTASPFASMFWYVNGVSIRECDETTCYTTGVSLPDNYILSNTGKIFYLEINPVTFNDNSTVACTDGQMSETVTLSPKTEITNVTLTRNETIDGNKMTVTVLSNCVEMASGATFELSKQKSSEQQFVQVTELTPTKTTIPCTNDENPNCGGNQTSRVSIVTNIQNDSTGDVYTFRLKVTYDGSDSWITLGTYTIATEDLDSSEDSSSWCKDNLNDCVSMSVVVSGVALSIIIAIIVAVFKGNTYILKFKDIPRSIDIADILVETYGFIVIDKKIDKPKHSLYQTVNHYIKVSTKKHFLPETISVNQLKLSLDHKYGRRPFENIYFFTEIPNQDGKEVKKKGSKKKGKKRQVNTETQESNQSEKTDSQEHKQSKNNLSKKTVSQDHKQSVSNRPGKNTSQEHKQSESSHPGKKESQEHKHSETHHLEETQIIFR